MYQADIPSPLAAPEPVSSTSVNPDMILFGAIAVVLGLLAWLTAGQTGEWNARILLPPRLVNQRSVEFFRAANRVAAIAIMGLGALLILAGLTSK